MATAVQAGTGGDAHTHVRPSCCQHLLAITGLVVGILVALVGIFAFCAIKGVLPSNAFQLQRFAAVGLMNSYFVMGIGTALAILSSAAVINICRRAGRAEY